MYHQESLIHWNFLSVCPSYKINVASVDRQFETEFLNRNPKDYDNVFKQIEQKSIH